MIVEDLIKHRVMLRGWGCLTTGPGPPCGCIDPHCFSSTKIKLMGKCELQSQMKTKNGIAFISNNRDGRNDVTPLRSCFIL